MNSNFPFSKGDKIITQKSGEIVDISLSIEEFETNIEPDDLLLVGNEYLTRSQKLKAIVAVTIQTSDPIKAQRSFWGLE